MRLFCAINNGVESPLRKPVGRHPGSVVITVARLSIVVSPAPLHDTESTPRAIWYVRHIMILSFSSCRCWRCWQDALRTRRVIHLSSTYLPSPVTSSGPSTPSSGPLDASVTSQIECVFLIRPSFVVYSLVADHILPCRGKLSVINSRTTIRLPPPLKSDDITFLALIQACGPLEQTTCGD